MNITIFSCSLILQIFIINATRHTIILQLSATTLPIVSGCVSQQAPICSITSFSDKSVQHEISGLSNYN